MTWKYHKSINHNDQVLCSNHRLSSLLPKSCRCPLLLGWMVDIRWNFRSVFPPIYPDFSSKYVLIPPEYSLTFRWNTWVFSQFPFHFFRLLTFVKNLFVVCFFSEEKIEESAKDPSSFFQREREGRREEEGERKKEERKKEGKILDHHFAVLLFYSFLLLEWIFWTEKK